MPDNVFDYIKSEEKKFGLQIEVMENWSWNFKDHVRMSLLMKYGKFIKATNDFETKNPKKNIVYSNLNLRYRAEDIDLKDVTLYADDEDYYHLSFLAKKYHDEVYVRSHDLDTFFDETKEEKIDLGGTIARKGVDGPVHEAIDSIAFCDQTSLTSGPICFKEFYAPDELLEKAKQGWGETANGADVSLDDLITMAEEAKRQDANNGQKTQTPGRYIEVYRLHGSLPTNWLQDDPKKPNKDRFTRQLQIVAYYDSKEGLKTGVTLYKKREYENPFKVHLSGRKIRNRALAFGGVEELFDPQLWTDYSEIRKRDILDAVSKVIRWTTDESFANKNKIRDMDSNQVLTLREGAQIGTLDTNVPNVALFNEWINEWELQAQGTSGATDVLQGKTPNAGTPFKLEQLVANQGQGLHEYRRGKFATWIAEIYKDWIIPDIAKEITNGVKFLATLSQDEMEYVSGCVIRSETNKWKLERILAGEVVTPEDVAAYEQLVRDDFARGGNKRFLEILKGELEGVTLKVKVDVAGKQKDLQALADRFSNIVKFVFSTYDPQTGKFAALEDPKAAKMFNKLIEYSGMDPIDFGYASQAQPQQPMQPGQLPQQQAPQPSPMQVPVAQPQYAQQS